MADPTAIPDPTAQLPALGGFTLDNTYGAVVIGFAAACVVYGILLTQAWTYFRIFRYDARLWKSLVVVVLLLETTDQAFIGHFVYFYTVTSIGNPLALATGTTTWSVILQQAFGSFVGTIVKCCFAARVYRFSERNIFITTFIVLLSLGQLIFALIFTVQAFALSSIPAVFRLKALATISLGLGALTDVVTAAALCFFLRRLRTGYKPADSLVRRLVTDAINTGVLTTAVSLTTLLLFDFFGGNLIFAATYFLLSKLYAISFLATLNTRRAVRGRGTDAESGALDETGAGGASGFPAALALSHSKPSRGGRSAQEETNIFHLGTRVPSFYAGEDGGEDEPYPFKGAESDYGQEAYAQGDARMYLQRPQPTQTPYAF